MPPVSVLRYRKAITSLTSTIKRLQIRLCRRCLHGMTLMQNAPSAEQAYINTANATLQKSLLTLIKTAISNSIGSTIRKIPHNNLELYIGGITNRFAAFTGNIIDDKPLRECTAAILTTLDKNMTQQRKSQVQRKA